MPSRVSASAIASAEVRMITQKAPPSETRALALPASSTRCRRGASGRGEGRQEDDRRSAEHREAGDAAPAAGDTAEEKGEARRHDGEMHRLRRLPRARSDVGDRMRFGEKPTKPRPTAPTTPTASRRRTTRWPVHLALAAGRMPAQRRPAPAGPLRPQPISGIPSRSGSRRRPSWRPGRRRRSWR